MNSVPRLLFTALLTQCLFSPTESNAQTVQQGNKLVGTGATGSASQGSAVAISSDGNTAIVGGCYDNSSVGAVWVYTRSGGAWSQQGSKLVGTGAVGGSMQGISVAISGDGNTAVVGGMSDNSNTGAAWVFTRSGGLWAQQGNKLVASDAVGAAQQGISVAISADGNTAVVGGMNDDANTGAAWVYTRSGAVWSQQGSKLVGTGAVGKAWQGTVAISGDGNTLLVGGPNDNGSVGAVWAFIRSGSVWSQQGTKLVGTGAVGASLQSSVALSGDGNTAVVGGPNDNGNQGGVWVFTRSGGVWSQQGNKLVGTGSVGSFIQQGYCVSLSSDGNTLVESSPCDNSYTGATWVFTRSGGTWGQEGTKLVGTGAVGNARQGQGASLSSDGSTLVVGGTVDNSNSGAAWVFVRSGSLLAGLVAHYPFNGDANDASGNGNNGTVYGASLTTDRFGTANKAYQFSSGNYIAVPHNPNLNVVGDFSVSAWYKTDGTGAPMDYMSIVGKRDDAFGIPSSFWCATIEVSTQRVALALFNDFSSLDYHFTSKNISQATWQHVVVVVRSDTSHIYLDGKLDSSSPISVPRPNNTKPLMIGWIRDTSPTSESFLGAIDDIRIYGRALTTVEISALYTPGSSLTAPVQISPSNGATGINQPGSLSWGTVSGATMYHVQVANDVAFANIVAENSGTSGTSYPVNGLPASSTFHWRVRASDGTNSSPWSNSWSFTTAGSTLSIPVLISPSNGVRNLVEPLSYNWNTINGATSYTVQVATDSLFASIVMGLGKTGVSAPPVTPQSSAIAGTVYYWRVNASDGTNTGQWSSVWNFAVVSGFNTPTLNAPANGGASQGTQASFTWSSVPSASVYHWQLATNPGFAPVTSEQSSLPSTAHSYSSLVPGTTYYWRVRAGNGTSWGSYSNTSSFAALPAFPSNHTLTTTISFPSKGTRSNYSSGDYRLFGLPGNSGTKVSGLLPGTPEVDWRVSWDNGSASSWIVRFDGNSTFNCTVGKGFWLLMTGPLNINTTVPSTTLNAQLESEIPLHVGWNIIVNPFISTLQWSAVKTANSITDPIYGFSAGAFNTSTVMDPYVGYYFYNTKNLSTLKIPYAGLFKPSIADVDPAEWRVTIALSTAGRIDRSTSFAVAPTEEVSTLNNRKPRSIEDVPSVWFDRPEWDTRSPAYATDVRPAGAALQTWDFNVRAEPGVGAVLGFEGLRTIPSGLAVRLLDRQRMKSIDLTQDSTYAYVPALPEERFTVLAGKPEEVGAEAETILPRHFALLNPFPNPFNPSVTIPVDLPATTEISLTVHDILGAHVRTLHTGPAPEGRGWFVWNGRDDAGRTVASGTYLIVLQGTEVPRLTTRVVFVR
jgi:hypothetical protein